MFLENEKIFLIENDRISSNKGDGKYVSKGGYLYYAIACQVAGLWVFI